MKDGGSIILNGSVASVKGTAAYSVYGATKAALRSFVRTWTSDLKDRHIQSNVVSPGPTDTPVIDGQPADAIARIVSTIPMGGWESRMKLPKQHCFWRRMTPASSPVLNCSLTAVEGKSDREQLRCCKLSSRLERPISFGDCRFPIRRTRERETVQSQREIALSSQSDERSSDCENNPPEGSILNEITQSIRRFGRREGPSHDRFDGTGLK